MRTPQAIIGAVLALSGAVFVLAIIGAELKPEDSVLIRLAFTIAALLAMLGGTIAAVSPAFVPGENQTPERYLTQLDRYQTGSAVFARQSFFASQPVKSIETGITYEQCISKARGSIAFKWTPEQLSSSRTECPTPNQLCVRSCVNDTCLCVNGRCV